MKPELQRIAIAEACGWVVSALGNWPHQMIVPSHLGGDGLSVRNCPDYLNDLNAMHDAEIYAIYTQGLGMVYLNKLFEASKADVFESRGVRLQRWHASATAAQRAEAFLRTLGKWTDSS